MNRVLCLFAIICSVGLFSPVVFADAVDDAFARGNDAASREAWADAAKEYEEAAALLPNRSAVISLNLGTVYAEIGDLGRATYHLERATDWRGGPTAEVAEAARNNLDVVRRQVELRATGDGTMVDRPANSWDLLVAGIESPGMGWFALVCGWLFLLTLFVHRRRMRAGRPGRGVMVGALIVLGICYGVIGLLHGWALRASSETPPAIVLDAQVDAREGPGQHRPVEFTLQGGARVRVVEQSPGWNRIQLPGGVSGWVPQATIGRLDAARGATGAL